MSIKMVCIDAGHGGHDSGAIGNDLKEKHVALHVAQQVHAILSSRSIAACVTRSDDTFVSLEDRVEYASKHSAELFVSIHCNSVDDDRANGFETFIFTGSKSSAPVQEAMHDRIYAVCKERGMRDRGKKQAGFYVIKNTKCPAILLELGFISNENDAAQLTDDEFLWLCSDAIADGIQAYLEYSEGRK